MHRRSSTYHHPHGPKLPAMRCPCALNSNCTATSQADTASDALMAARKAVSVILPCHCRSLDTKKGSLAAEEFPHATFWLLPNIRTSTCIFHGGYVSYTVQKHHVGWKKSLQWLPNTWGWGSSKIFKVRAHCTDLEQLSITMRSAAPSNRWPASTWAWTKWSAIAQLRRTTEVARAERRRATEDGMGDCHDQTTPAGRTSRSFKDALSKEFKDEACIFSRPP